MRINGVLLTAAIALAVVVGWDKYGKGGATGMRRAA
jgi:hypothetical protein